MASTSFISEKNIANNRPIGQSFNVIVGGPNAGKTYYLSEAENALYVAVEGEQGQGGFSPDFKATRLRQGPSTFPQLMGFLQEFIEANPRDPETRRPTQYDRLCLESFTSVFGLVDKYVCASEGVSHFDAKNTWQLCYTAAMRCMTDFCLMLQRVRAKTGSSVWISAHLRKWKDSSMITGQQVTYAGIDLPYCTKKQGGNTQEIIDMILKLADNVWFITQEIDIIRESRNTLYRGSGRKFITRQPIGLDGKLGAIPVAKSRGRWPLIMPATWNSLIKPEGGDLELFAMNAREAIGALVNSPEKSSLAERYEQAFSAGNFAALDSLIVEAAAISGASFTEGPEPADREPEKEDTGS